MSSSIEHPDDPNRVQSETSSLEPIKTENRQVRDLVQEAGGKVSRQLSTPTGAAVAAGGVAIGAALIFGPFTTALGMGAAYAAYRMMQKRKGIEPESPQGSPPPFTGS
jgi:hypothetical protein